MWHLLHVQGVVIYETLCCQLEQIYQAGFSVTSSRKLSPINSSRNETYWFTYGLEKHRNIWLQAWMDPGAQMLPSELSFFNLSAPFSSILTLLLDECFLLIARWLPPAGLSSFSFFFLDFIYLFLEGERERNISVWEKHQLTSSHIPQLGTKPTTQICALPRNWTGDLLVCRPLLLFSSVQSTEPHQLGLDLTFLKLRV